MPTIYFYNVPPAIQQAFTQFGLNPITVTEFPQPEYQDSFLWYARTEEEVMLFDKVASFERKIILAPETLTLENPSVTALLLRQNNVELYYPFIANNISRVFAPERHWYVFQTDANLSFERSSIQNPLLEVRSIKELVGTISIGISSLQHGAGSTFNSLTIARFLTSMGYKVAVVELKKVNDYSLIYLPRKDSYNSFHFRFENFDIFANDGEVSHDELIIEAMASNFNYIILDTGLLFQYDLDKATLDKPVTQIKKFEKGLYYNDFMKSDFKILNSFASTQYADSLEYLVNYLGTWNITDLHVLFSFAEEKQVRSYSKLLDSSAFVTPYNSSSVLTEEQKVFYDKLLNPIMPRSEIKKGRGEGLFKSTVNAISKLGGNRHV